MSGPNPTIVWHPAKAGSGWLEDSSSYRIKRASEYDYQAYHVEALWGAPQLVGHGENVAEARQVCEDHYARAHGAPITPKD